MIKNLKYFFQAIVIYLSFIFGKLIGLNASQKIFSFIFQKLGPLFKSKKIINNNLEIYSKNISKNEKETIIKNMWSNYGKTFIEYVFLNIYKKTKTYVTFEGEEIINKIFDDKKPVIFVSGHFANFEIMSMEIVKKKVDLATIYRPLNNYFLNPFMEFLRKKYVCKNQIKKGRNGVREAIKFINQGTSVALMIDQRVSEGETLTFFNRSALTTTLPSQLALKFNLNIVPVYLERNDNNFKIKFLPPIDSSKFKDKYELTNNLNKELEKMLVKNPNQWIWTHNRWKL